MEETKKAYELKPLTSKDVFPMFRIISKFGIGEFKKCFDPQLIKEVVNEQGEIKGDKLASIVGVNIAFDIASIVMENIPKCEDEIYNFLEQISNLKRKEIEKMSMLLKKRNLKIFLGLFQNCSSRRHRIYGLAIY